MLLNTDKTKLMLITNCQRRNTFAGNDLTLLYNDVELQITCCENIFGLHFDSNLEWTNHFQHVCKNISSNLWLFFSD